MTTTALARIGNNQSGDLFYDQHWVYDRPSVPSDLQRGSDMFPKVPLLFHRDADVFDSLSKTNTYGGDDMLPHIPVPQQRPYYILTMDPPQGPYMAR
ncbi:MAG: hypothetical protein PHD48_09880 [Alphaproteobacteria bacterium]|nr:hypothetical protein [Alphaproteobacteria bacterium]